MSKLPFNTPYNRSRVVPSAPAILPGQVVTQQTPANSLLIHNILARVKNGQSLSSLAQRSGIFIDNTILPSDLHTAQNLVLQARREFDTLPGKIRARFSDDPVKFLAFIQDPSNKAEAIALGLLSAPVDESSSAPAASAPPGSA